MNGVILVNNVAYTIFGGTGDLTFRKLLPAFYNLYAEEKMEENLKIIIIGRRDFSTQSYLKEASIWIKKFARIPYRQHEFEGFCEHIEYVQMDFTQERAYQTLCEYYQQQQLTQHIFYLAVAPRFFATIVQGLRQIPSAKDGKVIIEKPFGEDLKSAKELNTAMEAFFKKENIYHIDHYLGKEMVRNIQALRFMNPLFQNAWSKEYIEHIQISALETLGVENRGDYYDKAGALKDMVQNHLFQMLTILAMEEPSEYFKEDMKEKQLQVLKSLRPIDASHIQDSVVLGQYFDYQHEDKVADDSITETYAALRLFVDNERWQGVPFYIRTGKKLNRRETEVVITFKKNNPNVDANVLMIKIQPEEAVYFQFNIKKPGDSDEIILTRMDFCQSCLDSFRMNTPEAYERLLYAVANDEDAWFTSWDQIETSWHFVDELKRQFKQQNMPVCVYPSNTPGPKEADTLLTSFGHEWFKEPSIDGM